jgi:uncharacterized protein YqfA (UPF0365 family)
MRKIISRLTITASVIGLVLGITVASIVAVIFQGSILMLLAIAVISMATGFVTALGFILRIRLDTVTSWKILEGALTKAQEGNQVISATIISHKISGGNGNGTTRHTIQIEQPDDDY